MIEANKKYGLFQDPRYVGFNEIIYLHKNISTHEKFTFKGQDIHPAIIDYIHQNLDPRLFHEEELTEVIDLEAYYQKHGLNNDPSNLDDGSFINYIDEVFENIFLIQTEMHWMWGDYRNAYYLLELKDNIIKVIDKEIPDSVFPNRISHYKIEDNKVIAIADGCKFDLNLNKDEQLETINSC